MAELVSPPSQDPDMVLLSNGHFEYHAQANFIGVDSFTYRAYGYGGEDFATVYINVVNYPPNAYDETFSVGEGAASGTAVGTVTADAGDDDPHTWTLDGSGSFAIDAATGDITVSGPVNYETAPDLGDGRRGYVLTATADDGVATDTATVTVEVTNVAPTAVLTAVIAGDGVDLNATGSWDPEGGSLTYRWAIDGMIVDEASDWDRLYDGPGTGATVTVEVSDGELTGYAGVAITINDVVLDESTLDTIGLDAVITPLGSSVDPSPFVAPFGADPSADAARVYWSRWSESYCLHVLNQQAVAWEAEGLTLSAFFLREFMAKNTDPTAVIDYSGRPEIPSMYDPIRGKVAPIWMTFLICNRAIQRS